MKSLTSVRPIGNKILVERINEEMTAGGLFIPASNKDKQYKAKVIAVGTGVRLKSGKYRPIDVKEGDVILTGGCFGGKPVKIDGRELIAIAEADIFGVIEP